MYIVQLQNMSFKLFRHYLNLLTMLEKI